MTTLAPLDRTTTRPSALRRTAVVAAGVLACALPTIWTAGTVAELLTGAERDHLFHRSPDRDCCSAPCGSAG